MNNGSAPQTTMSSTTMPTRSMPMVSWRSIACAIATFVPTPSVDVASSRRSSMRNRPANPPRPPTTSGRVERSRPLMSSTARSPASMSTPAAAYVAPGPSTGVTNDGSRPLTGVACADARKESLELAVGRRVGAVVTRADRPRDALEHVLAEQLRRGQVDRVAAVEAGPAEPVAVGRGGRRQLLERDVGEGVGTDRRADLVDRQAVGNELGARREVDA